MSLHWDGEKELQIARLLLKSESDARGVNIPGVRDKLTLVPCENYPPRRYLTVNLSLANGMEVELTQTFVLNQPVANDYFRSVIRELLDAIEEIGEHRDQLIEQILDLRPYLEKKVAAERRQGLEIANASIGIEKLDVHFIDEMAPVLTLNALRPDLRFHPVDVVVESAADIDEVFDEIREELTANSAKLAKLREIGAVGHIHPFFAYEISRRNLPLAETLKAIHADPLPWQDLLDSAGDRMIASWQNGVLTGAFSCPDGSTFRRNRLEIEDPSRFLPTDSVGKNLADVLAILDLADFHLTVGRIRDSGFGKQEILIVTEPIPYDEDGNLLSDVVRKMQV